MTKSAVKFISLVITSRNYFSSCTITQPIGTSSIKAAFLPALKPPSYIFHHCSFILSTYLPTYFSYRKTHIADRFQHTCHSSILAVFHHIPRLLFFHPYIYRACIKMVKSKRLMQFATFLPIPLCSISIFMLCS